MQVTTKSALHAVSSTNKVAKAVKQPTGDFKHQAVPWHLQAVLNASEAVLEHPRGIAKAATNQLQQPQQSMVVASEFNAQGEHD